MTKGKLLTLSAFIVAMLSCSKKDKGDDAPPPVDEKVKAVQETLKNDTDLQTFSEAFARVNISSTDAAQGLTVFAPLNDAIEAYDPNARVRAEELTESEVKDHIVKGIYKLADITNGKKLISLSGKELVFAVENDKIWVNGALIGEAKEDSTGVVFVIDKVLSAKPGKAEITVYDGTLWSVSDPEGKAVAGAEVALYYTRNDFQLNQPAFSGETDASGKIVFGNLPAGTYYLVAKKGDKLNYFDPSGSGASMVAYKAVGIYQNQEEISNSAFFPNVVPGDFKFEDANADGVINADDKVAIPFEITINTNKTSTVTSYIGYTFNHIVDGFKNKAEAQQLLDDVYTQLGNWQIQQAVMDGILTDDADCSGFQAYCQLDNFNLTTNNAIITNFWQTGYNSIGSLNKIILNLPGLMLPASEADLFTAQAKALRAYIYLQLATYFGDLPLQETIVPQANMVRENLPAVYSFIKSDLTSAINVLPGKWIGADAKRIGANACKLLLARVAAAEKDFSKVEQYSNDIMQSLNYSLVDAGDVFVTAGNAEIIWNISATIPQQYSTFFTGKTFVPALRYAEVLLLNTEAAVQMGNADVNGLNMVRARRGLDPVSFMGQSQAINDVRAMWKTEHSREGQRFAKLIQWETIQDVLGPNGYQFWHNVLPIPQTVMDQYFNIQQNPGY